MKKKLTTLVVLFLAAGLLATGLFACGKTEEATTDTGFGTVWSAPSTVKILQDDIEYEEKGECELVYNTVKNEYESAQLIITATKDIESFYLAASDLTGDAGTLSVDNITVYYQKQIPVTETFYFENETTYVPDALIPMDNALEYGETETAADTNAGLWITIYIPEDQEAGVYTGTFLLTVDGEEVEVPVSVTVNDYTLTDENKAITLFSWRLSRVGAGELDYSVEMMETYYEFFLEYGISLQSLPVEAITPEEIMTALDEYWDDITTFCLMKYVGSISGNISYYSSLMTEQVLTLAENSSTERNYLSKAYIYTLDEPDFTSSSAISSYITEMTACIEILEACADTIAADTTGIYDDFKAIDGWREYVVNIPRIVPVDTTWLLNNQDTEDGQAILACTNCLCPVWRCFTENNIEKINTLCEKYDILLWWYGCINPKAPGATYHIGDANLLSSRTISWLQKKYNITGNLYWDAAGSTNDDAGYDQYTDLYTSPYRNATVPAGDGFLAYPGSVYGIYGPIPSIRLMSVRDGQEEYSLLADLEDYYVTLEEIYGDAFSAEEAMNYFYSMLYYDGYYMYADGENGLDFDSLRAELIDTLCWMSNGNDFAFCYGDAVKNVVSVSIFAADGVAISVNGNDLERNADGYFTYDLNLTEETTLTFVVAGIDGVTYIFERFIGLPTDVLSDYSDSATLEGLVVTDGSSVSLVETDVYSTEGSAAYFDVTSVVTGNTIVDVSFVPYGSIAVSTLSLDKLTDYGRIRIVIYNPGEEFDFTLRFYSGTSFVDIGDYTLGVGENIITVDMDSLNFSLKDSIDRIAFEFANATDDDENVVSYKFYVGSIIGIQ